MRIRSIIGGGAGLLASLLVPSIASAHAFGQQYTLPLPVNLYILGASIALIASFVILTFFSAPAHAAPLSDRPLPRWLQRRSVSIGAHTLGLLVLALTVLSGIFGPQTSTGNLADFFFWIALLLVMTYVSAIVSGVWDRIDPFRTIAEFVFPASYQPLMVFPRLLKYVPALLVYYFVLWFELLSYGAGAVPYNIALFLLGYAVLALIGSAVFGAEAWFRWGDFFSVFFRTIGAFAPYSIEGDRFVRSYPGARLVRQIPENSTLVIFLLLTLSSTAFDGIRDTLPWVRFFAAHDSLFAYYAQLLVIVLLASPFLFFALYAVVILCMRELSGKRHLIVRFAYSLVPIALAYSVAHYISLVISEGQNVLPILSDPLGKGWNLLGTAAYQYNPGLVGAKTIWHVQVASIVIGHIVATFVAHRIAQETFDRRSHVILTQLPMLILMLIYTAVGLWILSLPYSPGA